MTLHHNVSSLRTIVFTVIIFTAVSAAIGGGTNTINSQVSQDYFITIMQWENVGAVSRIALAQGIFEGILYGLMLGCIFAWNVGTFRYTLRSTIRYIFGIALGTCITWGIGGFLAMGLAALSPEFYRQTFIGVPDNHAEMLAYAA